MIVRMCVCMYVCSSWNEIKFLLYQINTRNPLITGFSLLITTLISHIIFMFQFNWCNRKLKWKLKSWNKISTLVGWGGCAFHFADHCLILGSEQKSFSESHNTASSNASVCAFTYTKGSSCQPSCVGLPLNSFHRLGYRMPLMPFFFFLFWHTHISLTFSFVI